MNAEPIEYSIIKLGEYTKRLKLTNRSARELERLQGVSIFRMGDKDWLQEKAGLEFFSNAIYCGLQWSYKDSPNPEYGSPDAILDKMEFSKIEEYIGAITDMFNIWVNGGKRPKQEQEEEKKEIKKEEEPTPQTGETISQ